MTGTRPRKGRKSGVGGGRAGGGARGGSNGLAKCPSGISGLDQITSGGLPRGRPTLLCGGAGCGKTLMAMQFLVRGALEYDEPGVFVAFEETAGDLAANVASLGVDLADLERRKRIAIDHVRVQRHEIEETGEYDLEGLFVRLAWAVESVGAKRIVLDTIETLFSGLPSTGILRAELIRLFGWIKEQGLTAVITAEQGGGKTLTRHGIEEYVSDCVIQLDHRVDEQVSTRRLRVIKYRGSIHGTNEYPFLIDDKGISVLPVTSVGLEHKVSNQRVSTGVAAMDEMFGGKGYYRGSTVVVAGTPGTGKSSLASYFADATCRRGEQCLYFAFEESPAQIIRNMASVGLDLDAHVRKGLLHLHAARPTIHGLETHLVVAHQLTERIAPSVVVLDPVSNLLNAGEHRQVHTMLLRLLDYFKGKGVTTLMTTLTNQNQTEHTDVSISSLIDTWIVLKDIQSSSERNRGMYILKSRGMNHSNQVREYRLTDHGFELLEPYTGVGGAVTGSARVVQEARELAEESARRGESRRRQAQMAAERGAVEAQIAALQARLHAQQEEVVSAAAHEEARQQQVAMGQQSVSRSRQAEPEGSGRGGSRRRKGVRK